jgi:DNA (cytosine-5)-methyltransferase 1
MNYYNEFDAKAAAWLRELIKRGLIPAGDVDTRSITEIKPHELTRYTQCHFFAGIGGWSLALQLAGWPSTRPVWTGSAPCQPFSTAGKQLAQADERHLWPVFFNLIRECRPECVFGEQVASAIGKGWLDGVSSDLEGADYACGSAVLGAHSVGAPHIRQRLYWVADATGGQREQPIRPQGNLLQRSSDDRSDGRVADAAGGGQRIDGSAPGSAGHPDERSEGCWLADARSLRCNPRITGDGRGQESEGSAHGELTDRHGRLGDSSSNGSAARLSEQAQRQEGITRIVDDSGGSCGAWDSFSLIPCADGKARRIEPGTPPLAHGIPARVVRLRGYGNAIVPQVAAEFVMAYQEITR